MPNPTATGDESALHAVVERAVSRSRKRLADAMPRSAGRIAEWMASLAPGRDVRAYFLHPRAFPALQLPWWLDQTSGPGADLPFHADLVYSTMQGYFAIRLLDDVMDHDPRACVALLPACAFLHAEFESVYRRCFAADHPFWREFDRHWYGTADAAIADGVVDDIDLAAFSEIAARKVDAALIPLVALCHYKGIGLPVEWGSLFRQLAEWHQLRNDFFDWHRDLERGGTTFLLCEARRRGRPGETVAAWMVREGMDWSISTLRDQLRCAHGRARALQAHGVVRYIERQADELQEIAHCLTAAKGGDGLLTHGS
jgi:hypothetical protein